MGRVIVTVFCGRQDRTSILLGYLRRLCDAGKVDEVHLWDYCRQEADRRWLRGLGASLRYTAPIDDYVGEVGLVGARMHRFRVQARTNARALFVSEGGAEHELFIGDRSCEFRAGNTILCPSRCALAPFPAWSDVVVSWTPTSTSVSVNGQKPTSFERPRGFDPVKAFHSGDGCCWDIPAHTEPFLRYFSAEPHSVNKWRSYYRYYYDRRDSDFSDTIIKCDDDVVAVDTEHFSDFVRFREQNPQHLLVFPNIVNNGIAAFYQQQNGAIPKALMVLERPRTNGSLWESAAKCAALHSHFLSDPTRFAYDGFHVLEPPLRFSINFFAILPKDLVCFESVGDDDEHFLAVDTCVRLGRTKCVYNGMYVSHLSFFSQESGLDTASLLASYEALLDSSARRDKKNDVYNLSASVFALAI